MQYKTRYALKKIKEGAHTNIDTRVVVDNPEKICCLSTHLEPVMRVVYESCDVGLVSCSNKYIPFPLYSYVWLEHS